MRGCSCRIRNCWRNEKGYREQGLNKMKRFLITIASVVLVAVPLFMIIVPQMNDNIAKKVAEDILSVPLPENTTYIESKSLAGKLVGNGNGMQYLGAILIQSGLELDTLQAYYSSYADNEWTYIVEPQLDNKINVIEHGYLEFDSDINGDGYFIVYSWGDTDSIIADLDIRGH